MATNTVRYAFNHEKKGISVFFSQQAWIWSGHTGHTPQRNPEISVIRTLLDCYDCMGNIGEPCMGDNDRSLQRQEVGTEASWSMKEKFRV